MPKIFEEINRREHMYLLTITSAINLTVSCRRLLDALLLLVALILFVGMTGCGSMHNKIETNVSAQYNPQDVTNIYVYTDFLLSDSSHGRMASRLHKGLSKALTAQNIAYTLDAEDIEMNTENTLSQAVKNNKDYLLVLEFFDEQTIYKCRVSLYDTSARKVVLRSLVQTGHANIVSANESPYRLADMIINEIKKNR